MASLLKKSSSSSSSYSQSSLDNPVNDSRPIRIALLGGARSGKTSIISKLSLGSFRDTYYPTHQTQPILFHFIPTSLLSRCILDQHDMTQTLQLMGNSRPLIISPVIYQAYSKLANANSASASALSESAESACADNSDIVITNTNQFYTTYKTKSTREPYTTPILVELIDTAAFNPDQVVPFLEASLYIKLDRDILKNLANEPRRPVSTNPLLVASGASELNGSVDGYFFVYSAVPSYNPPSYNEVLEAASSTSSNNSTSYDDNDNTLTITNTPGDTTFSLLSIMKMALSEAWKEYHTYKTRWEQGKESDIFSLKSALKNMWRDNTLVENSRQDLRSNSTKLKLLDTSVDPADPSCPPPIWVICTHSHNQLASPKSIEDGIKLSKFWKCGFIAIDVADDSIDETLALIIREILERKILQSKFSKKKKKKN